MKNNKVVEFRGALKFGECSRWKRFCVSIPNCFSTTLTLGLVFMFVRRALPPQTICVCSQAFAVNSMPKSVWKCLPIFACVCYFDCTSGVLTSTAQNAALFTNIICLQTQSGNLSAGSTVKHDNFSVSVINLAGLPLQNWVFIIDFNPVWVLGIVETDIKRTFTFVLVHGVMPELKWWISSLAPVPPTRSVISWPSQRTLN